LDGAFLAAALAVGVFGVVALAAGLADVPDFDPAACVFVFFAGAFAALDVLLGAPGGGVVSGAVTRAS
jgi:hypothetical protein